MAGASSRVTVGSPYGHERREVAVELAVPVEHPVGRGVDDDDVAAGSAEADVREERRRRPRVGDVVPERVGGAGRRVEVVVALEQVVAVAAAQPVVVRAADEPVVAGVAEEHVLAVVDRRSRSCRATKLSRKSMPGATMILRHGSFSLNQRNSSGCAGRNPCWSTLPTA